MLSMDFEEELNKILASLPANSSGGGARSTYLFSATMTSKVNKPRARTLLLVFSYMQFLPSTLRDDTASLQIMRTLGDTEHIKSPAHDFVLLTVFISPTAPTFLRSPSCNARRFTTQ